MSYANVHWLLVAEIVLSGKRVQTRRGLVCGFSVRGNQVVFTLEDKESMAIHNGVIEVLCCQFDDGAVPSVLEPGFVLSYQIMQIKKT